MNRYCVSTLLQWFCGAISDSINYPRKPWRLLNRKQSFITSNIADTMLHASYRRSTGKKIEHLDWAY